jgi:putative tricarboxylic transport membrane protein
MEFISLSDITWAFQQLFSVNGLLLLGVGVIAGMIFGAAPGVTAIAGLAVITPITFSMSFAPAMALLLGAYTGGYFAGSIPAILINTPGTPANAATAVDGYQMAKNGKADQAISLAVICSVIGGLISVLILATLAPNLAKIALKFTSVEYFSLALLGLAAVAAVSGASLFKGLAGAFIGMLMATVGLDPVEGTIRLTFEVIELQGGIPIIPALIGLFGITELFSKARESHRIATVLPPQDDFKLSDIVPVYMRNRWITIKSALIGTVIGILPGIGPAIASWVSYGEAVRAGKPGDKFGEGEEKGVIAAETANNAVTGGAMVPLLTVGIPGDPVTAVLIGALLIQGIDPGPFFIRDNGDKFVFIFMALGLANIMMLFLGLGARKFLRFIVKIPNYSLVPVVAILSAAGGYAVNSAPFEVNLIIFVGIGGYFLMRMGFPMAPIVIGVVLGPIIEENLRNGLAANNMDPTIFITRPISAGILVLLVILVGFLSTRGKKIENA